MRQKVLSDKDTSANKKINEKKFKLNEKFIEVRDQYTKITAGKGNTALQRKNTYVQ